MNNEYIHGSNQISAAANTTRAHTRPTLLNTSFFSCGSSADGIRLMIIKKAAQIPTSTTRAVKTPFTTFVAFVMLKLDLSSWSKNDFGCNDETNHGQSCPKHEAKFHVLFCHMQTYFHYSFVFDSSLSTVNNDCGFCVCAGFMYDFWFMQLAHRFYILFPL